MSRPRSIAIAALVALTLVAGCSSSDGSEGADAKATTTTARDGSDRSTTTAADGGADDGASTTTEAGSTTPTTTGGDIVLEGDFCAKAKQLEGVSDDLFGESTTDTSPDALLASLKQLFRQLDNVYRQLQADAPAEIADDIDLVAEFASSNYEKVKDMDSYEDAADIAQDAFSGDAESDEFQAASDRIGAFVEEECGLTTE